jgi:hypothetical protein
MVPVVDPLSMVMLVGNVTLEKSALATPVPLKVTCTVWSPVTVASDVAVSVIEVEEASEPVVVFIPRVTTGFDTKQSHV